MRVHCCAALFVAALFALIATARAAGRSVRVWPAAVAFRARGKPFAVAGCRCCWLPLLLALRPSLAPCRRLSRPLLPSRVLLRVQSRRAVCRVVLSAAAASVRAAAAARRAAVRTPGVGEAGLSDLWWHEGPWVRGRRCESKRRACYQYTRYVPR